MSRTALIWIRRILFTVIVVTGIYSAAWQQSLERDALEHPIILDPHCPHPHVIKGAYFCLTAEQIGASRLDDSMFVAAFLGIILIIALTNQIRSCKK